MGWFGARRARLDDIDAAAAAAADEAGLDEVDAGEDGLYVFEPPLQNKTLGRPVIVADKVFRAFAIRSRRGEGGGTRMTQALQSISLHPSNVLYPIRQGEFVVIRGPSGGGKTTLLNLFGALDIPSGGELTVLGTHISPGVSENELAKLRLDKIGFVFQTFNLMSALSAHENVELPMLLRGIPADAKQRAARASSLLEDVGLADRFAHLPSELSGGEQQRVAIARALANDPPLLLLDEPTGDLDTKNTVQVMDLLLRINQQRRTTCVMVTHNPDLECYADRILYVRDGLFEQQVINTEQSTLEMEAYEAYLRRTEQTAQQREASPNVVD